MYAFLAMVLLMLLWALRLWYRMHQEETVYAVYKKSDYIFCAAFLLLGILICTMRGGCSMGAS